MKKKLLILCLTFFAFQLNAQTISESDILVYLKFDGNFTDSSSNNVTFDGSAGNAVTYETGQFGQSADFDLSSYVSTSAHSFNPMNSFTIAAWINIDEVPSVLDRPFSIMHQQDGPDTGRVQMEVIKAGDLVSTFTDGERLSASTVPTVGTWIHIAHVVDRSTPIRALYINGTLEGTYTPTKTENTTSPMVIGSNKGQGGSFLSGNIDEFVIVNRVLSGAEITAIKDNGVQSQILGINNVAKDDTSVKIFVSNNKILSYETTSKISKSEVYSITGQKLINIEKANNNRINVNKLSTGVYILKLQSEDKISTKKFVIK